MGEVLKYESREPNSWPTLPVPSVVIGELMRRPALTPHIIAFANEKGGVGKTTLAFHSAIALCHAGAKVLVIDLDIRQRSMSSSLEMRDATARTLKIELPAPKFLSLEKQSSSLLDQEIRRLGSGVDFVVLDLPGADTAVARYSLALANTIVTPIGSSSYDLNTLAQFNPLTQKLSSIGHFGKLVDEIRSKKVHAGLGNTDWIVLKNRVRGGDRRLEKIITASLDEIASALDFRIALGLPESISFRDLNNYGLTYLDIGLIPGIGSRNYKIERLIGDLLRNYSLPGFSISKEKNQKISLALNKGTTKAMVSNQSKESYYINIANHRSMNGD